MRIAAADPVEAVAVAALEEVRELAGIEQLSALLDILLETESKDVIRAATHALVAVCARRPATGEIAIVRATYGAEGDGKLANVKKKVTKLVSRGASAIEATNANFGDPAPGTPKRLTIEYTVDGAPVRKSVAEKETLMLTSPDTPPDLLDPMVAALARASGSARIALLRVLDRLGGPGAREAIASVADDEDPEVRDTVKRLLAE
jgi:hypothetical protein